MEKIKIIDENGLEDNIESEIGVNHIEALIKTANKYGIIYDRVNPDVILKSFADRNYIVLLNLGLLSGKITYTITLPSSLSNPQISYMENQKENFYSKCDFLGIYVNTDEKTKYNTLMRNLILENEIYNLKFEHITDILYNEVDNQKRNSK